MPDKMASSSIMNETKGLTMQTEQFNLLDDRASKPTKMQKKLDKLYLRKEEKKGMKNFIYFQHCHGCDMKHTVPVFDAGSEDGYCETYEENCLWCGKSLDEIMELRRSSK